MNETQIVVDYWKWLTIFINYTSQMKNLTIRIDIIQY